MKKNTPKRQTTLPKAAPAAKPVSPITAAAATPVIAETKAVATPVATITVPVSTKPVVAPVAAFPADQIERLRDGSVETAVEAIEILAKTGDKKAVAPLAGILANEDGYFHVVTRATAAVGLGKLNFAESIDALVKAATDSQAEVSREAVLALGELKAASAAATLIKIVENSDGFYLNVVRHAAIRSLGRTKASAAKPILARIAAEQGDDALSTAAREAMGQL